MGHRSEERCPFRHSRQVLGSAEPAPGHEESGRVSWTQSLESIGVSETAEGMTRRARVRFALVAARATPGYPSPLRILRNPGHSHAIETTVRGWRGGVYDWSLAAPRAARPRWAIRGVNERFGGVAARADACRRLSQRDHRPGVSGHCSPPVEHPSARGRAAAATARAATHDDPPCQTGGGRRLRCLRPEPRPTDRAEWRSPHVHANQRNAALSEQHLHRRFRHCR